MNKATKAFQHFDFVPKVPFPVPPCLLLLFLELLDCEVIIGRNLVKAELEIWASDAMDKGVKYRLEDIMKSIAIFMYLDATDGPIPSWLLLFILRPWKNCLGLILLVINASSISFQIQESHVDPELPTKKPLPVTYIRLAETVEGHITLVATR